jgi:Fuc2NAc and GlcNAc transferase
VTGWIALVVAAVCLIAASVVAGLMTGLIYRYAWRKSLLDIPGPRSSHSMPTPRGGGLSIAMVVLTGIGVATAIGWVDRALGVGLAGGGALIALIGWLDDHRGIRVRWRAVAHVTGAAWFVGWVGAPASLWLGPWEMPLGPLAPAIGVVGLVWCTNLFNFMDGIDGIAGSEAVCVCALGGALLLINGGASVAAAPLLVTAATFGFLVWNWPPAKIFMGDVGSGFLGFSIGAIAVASDISGAVPLVVWGILLGVFLFDATVTLLRRLPRERFYEAHRRHAYQRALAAGATHETVTKGVLALNVVLAVLAVTALAWPRGAPVAILAAVAVLTIVYLHIEGRRPMWMDVIRAPNPRKDHQ